MSGGCWQLRPPTTPTFCLYECTDIFYDGIIKNWGV
jgi:hypothetical protein